jgi:hypothetical protein
MFGSQVSALAAEVTDDKRLDRQVRKERQIAHAARKSPDAAVITLADRLTANAFKHRSRRQVASSHRSNCRRNMSDRPLNSTMRRVHRQHKEVAVFLRANQEACTRTEPIIGKLAQKSRILALGSKPFGLRGSINTRPLRNQVQAGTGQNQTEL